MLCARCFDAFTDLLMGWAVDYEESEMGEIPLVDSYRVSWMAPWLADSGI